MVGKPDNLDLFFGLGRMGPMGRRGKGFAWRMVGIWGPDLKLEISDFKGEILAAKEHKERKNISFQGKGLGGSR
jgi:hypothetical protein